MNKTQNPTRIQLNEKCKSKKVTFSLDTKIHDGISENLKLYDTIIHEYFNEKINKYQTLRELARGKKQSKLISVVDMCRNLVRRIDDLEPGKYVAVVGAGGGKKNIVDKTYKPWLVKLIVWIDRVIKSDYEESTIDVIPASIKITKY